MSLLASTSQASTSYQQPVIGIDFNFQPDNTRSHNVAESSTSDRSRSVLSDSASVSPEGETDINEPLGEAGAESSTNSSRYWTSEEDDRLRNAVKELGENAWKQVAEIVGGSRNSKGCKKRWVHSIGPGVRKGRWSKEEDQLLIRLYNEWGPKWHEIAQHIPGRKDDQCAKRWRDTLNPELTAAVEWTSEEDGVLVAGFAEVGPKWTAISDKLPGRSGMHCRNRYRRLIKLSTAWINKDERGTASPPLTQEQMQTMSEAAASTSVLRNGSRSRSPHLRPAIARAGSSTGTPENVHSPLDSGLFPPSLLASTTDSSNGVPFTFPSPLASSSNNMPMAASHFNEHELAFLRDHPRPEDSHQVLDWETWPFSSASPSTSSTSALPNLPAQNAAPLVSRLSSQSIHRATSDQFLDSPQISTQVMCRHCNGRGFVDTALPPAPLSLDLGFAQQAGP